MEQQGRTDSTNSRAAKKSAFWTTVFPRGISCKLFLHLARLSWQILRLYGVKGLALAIERYFQKVKSERQGQYPRAQDYTRGLVTVAILTKNRLDLIRPCLEAIYRYGSAKYQLEILLGDTGSEAPEVWQYYRQVAQRHRHIKIVKLNSYYFSKNYNELIDRYARGQYLVLLNNDTVVTGGWLEQLLEPLADTQIGIVGAKLLYQDDTIQHAGIEFNRDGNAFHIYCREPRDFPGADYRAEVPAVTFACVALRHDVYARFQMDENYQEEAQDTDFCFRLAAAGFKALYNPDAEVYHWECSSRDWRRGLLDRLRLQRIWAAEIKGLQAREAQRRPFDPGEYRNAVTVIRHDGIGDLLMGICAFRKLRERYPDKKLLLATYRRNIDMMAGFGIFDQFIMIPDDRRFSPLPIPRASQVHDFTGLELEFDAFWGLTTEDNKIHRHLVYTRELGLAPDYELPAMPHYPEARRRVLRLLASLGADAPGRFAVLCLVATNPARSWWEPYYPRLLKAVKDAGLTPLIVGTGDSEYFHEQGVINLSGKTATITEYIEAVKMGKYVISTDTSAYHIAALSGIPFLAIFTGGVKPEARLKFYTDYEVAAPPPSLDCYPCWDVGCKDLSVRWQSDPCRLAVTPEEVIGKFHRLVARFP